MIILICLSRNPSNSVNKEVAYVPLTTIRVFVKLTALQLPAVTTKSGQGALRKDQLIQEAIHVHPETNKRHWILGGVDQ
jgi:hypothetical protein